jgi:hypothetical protein
MALAVIIAGLILYGLFVYGVLTSIIKVSSLDQLQTDLQHIFAGVLLLVLGLELMKSLESFFVGFRVQVEIIVIVAIIESTTSMRSRSKFWPSAGSSWRWRSPMSSCASPGKIRLEGRPKPVERVSLTAAPAAFFFRRLLTAREPQVIKLVADSNSNKRISKVPLHQGRRAPPHGHA